MRILAANPDGLGDLMLRQPLYTALLAAGHQLMLTVRAQWAPIASYIAPGASIATFEVDPYQLSIRPEWERLQPALDAAKKFAPDLFLITPFQWTLAEEWLAANLLGVRVVGFAGHLFSNDPRWGVKAQSNLRFNQQIAIPEESTELAKNQALAREILGAKTRLSDPKLKFSKENLTSARAQLDELGLRPGKFWIGWVGHGPYTELHNWRLENWSNVLGFWAKKYRRRFLLMGGPDESATTELVRAAVTDAPAGSIVTLCRNTPLQTVAGLIQLSGGYIGRDTGPMHLAAAAGKPVIAVFGGGTWPRFAPATEPSWISTVSVPCVGCGWRCPFDQSYCIKQVPVKEVRDAIDDLEGGRLKGRVVRNIKPGKDMTGEIVRQMMSQIENKTFETQVAVTDHKTNQQEWETRMAVTVETFTAGLASIRQPLEEKITAVAGGISALRDERGELERRLQLEQESMTRLQKLLDDNNQLIKQLDGRRTEEAAAQQSAIAASEQRHQETVAALDQQYRATVAVLEQQRQSESAAHQQAVDASMKLVEQSRESAAAELAEAHAKLEQSGRALSAAIDRGRQLEAQLRENEIKFEKDAAGLARVSDELASNRFQVEEMRDQWEEAQKELGQLKTALAVHRRTPVNPRPWPYAAPQDIALPATLPDGKPWPRISIVTPSFNQGKHIEQTILSIKNQNYPNLQYILIDGGSTDETMEVVDRYRSHIHYAISEKDGGQSNAINKGFARADGDLLTWINSDDMLEPGALAAMAMAFHTSGADIVAGLCTLHSAGQVVGRHLTACADGPLPLRDLLDIENCWLRGQFFYQPEVMFTRDLWQRAGGTVDENLFYSMDYDLWVRFAKLGAVMHVIGRPIARYRVHEDQKTFEMKDYEPELHQVRDRYVGENGSIASTNGVPPGFRSHLRVVFFNDLGSAGGRGSRISGWQPPSRWRGMWRFEWR